MAETKLLYLPWELVLNVMTCFLPSNPTALVPASDQATQLLLDFTSINRAAHEFALRRIRQHCIVLDSDDRLRRFLLCLELSRASGLGLASVFEDIHTMYLAPFGSVMDNLPTAAWVRDVFGYASGTLKRLIVDMPFESLPPWNDHLNVGPVLLEGFERLTSLEEFVCTRDATRLRARVPEDGARSILDKWPKIRRVGMNRPTGDSDFWQCLAQLPLLDHVILTAIRGRIERRLDFRELFSQMTGSNSALTILLADIHKKQIVSSPADEPAGLPSIDPDDRIHVMAAELPIPKPKKFLDSNSDWLVSTALAGELWDARGVRITELPPFLLTP